MYRVIFIFCILLCHIPLAFGKGNQERIPFQLQGVYAGIGSGVAAGYHLDENVFAGTEILEESSSGTDEDVSYNLSFLTNQWVGRFSIPEVWDFYLQGGLVFRDWILTASGPDLIGSSTDFTYSPKMKVTVQWPTLGYNFGLGYNWIDDTGFSLGINYYTILGGAPEITIEDTAGAATDSQLAAEKKYWETNFGEPYTDISTYGVSLGYNF